MDYNELLNDTPVAAFARNNDLVAEMPNVIARAETYVINRLDHDAFRVADVIMPVNTADVQLPPDVLDLRSVTVKWRGGYAVVRQRDADMLDALYPTVRQGARPLFYAQINPHLIRLYPEPARQMELKIAYNAQPRALSAQNPTNVLTQDYPEAIRAAVLREAAVYMGDAELISAYTQEAADTLSMANMAIARRLRDNNTRRPTESRNVKGA